MNLLKNQYLTLASKCLELPNCARGALAIQDRAEITTAMQDRAARAWLFIVIFIFYHPYFVYQTS